MSLYNTLVYYYLIVNQKSINMYNYCIMVLLGFKNLIVYSGNNKNILTTLRFLIYIALTKIINFVYRLRDKVDIKADKVQLTNLMQNSEQTIIIDKELYDDEKEYITFEDVIFKLNLLQTNDSMMTQMIINLDLVNDNEKVCLKNYMIKYKDIEELHHHTLKNILIFNDIKHNENSFINIKLIKDKKMVTQKIPLTNIIDKHINHLIKL